VLQLTSIFSTSSSPASKQFFEEAGEVVDVRLSTFEDGSFKGYGHVEFATAEAAQKVNNQLTIFRYSDAQLSRVHLLQKIRTPHTQPSSFYLTPTGF
jgi:RNA recognition motif-containing protein